MSYILRLSASFWCAIALLLLDLGSSMYAQSIATNSEAMPNILTTYDGNLTHALWNYIHKRDATFHFENTNQDISGISVANGVRWKGSVLNLTSQAWMSPREVGVMGHIWYHSLVVIVPDNLKFKETAVIYITGGNNPNGKVDPTGEDVQLVTTLATNSACIGIVLFQVPNQPITFPSDPLHKNRNEDEVLGFSWAQFMKHPDVPEWNVLLPMVNSAIKAMDAVTAFCHTDAQKNCGGAEVKKFIVAGASKRGWTTWLTAAVDSARVVAIVPVVMDLLDTENSLAHMFRAYGGWTFAFGPYWEQNLTLNIGTPSWRELAAIIDPLNYKANLTMPKLVVDSTGDEFFMPDDDYFWWGTLPGETKRLMIPNAEHSMATGIEEVLHGISGFCISILEKIERPKVIWTMHQSNTTATIRASTSVRPAKAFLWTADTLTWKNISRPLRRDFRLATDSESCQTLPVNGQCIQPVLWLAKEISPEACHPHTGQCNFSASRRAPVEGWRGFFIEFKFDLPKAKASQSHHDARAHTWGPAQWLFTTQINIVPQRYPFPDCRSLSAPLACKGNLV